MAGSRDAIKEIRDRVRVLDVVSEYVTLKRAGKSYKGLCPFHSEKTPSFTVSEEFQTWHCFGCGEHGDVFSFLMKAETLTFGEALERLAKRAGVELSRFQGPQVSRKELLGRVNATALAYYCILLRRTSAAMKYLRGRGVLEKTVEQFKLGYAGPTWDGLASHLARKGINLADAAQAGLLIRRDRAGGYYDRFRHRIIFPIFDIQERVIAFGGRALDEDDQPKYVNSPETPLFSKTRVLYGLNFARRRIPEEDLAVVVEGYMDVITAHQAGFAHCVATLGSALTREHIDMLARYTKRVVLAFDADSAGMSAGLRGASMFDEAGCEVRIARLPDDADPDSLLRSGLIAEFSSALSGALPIVDYRLLNILEKHDTSTPAGKADMLKEAVKVLAEVPANIERERYIRTLARYHPNFETGTTRAEEHIRRDVELMARRRSRGFGRRQPEAATVGTKKGLREAELSVLRVLIRGEQGAEAAAQALTPEDFSEETTRAAATAVFEATREDGVVSLPNVLESASKEVGELLSALAMQEDWEPIGEKALEDFITRIKKASVKKLRTSDVLAPYLAEGTIGSEEGRREQMIKQLEQFLRESGKLPPAGESSEMNESDGRRD